MTTLLPDWDTDKAMRALMDDSGDKRELPCPTCGEETTNGEQCELCKQEANAVEKIAKRLTKNTLDKYPPLPPFTGMGSGMP